VCGVTPSGEDAPLDRQLVIAFSAPMVALGALSRVPPVGALSITPPLDCEWRWLNPYDLSCRLSRDAALRPATRYRVALAKGVTSRDGLALGKTVTHTFVTAPFKVQ